MILMTAALLKKENQKSDVFAIFALSNILSG